jgi:hypothetical protein
MINGTVFDFGLGTVFDFGQKNPNSKTVPLGLRHVHKSYVV